jgi:vanillate O-demethylase ferredoxin subunit
MHDLSGCAGRPQIGSREIIMGGRSFLGRVAAAIGVRAGARPAEAAAVPAAPPNCRLVEVAGIRAEAPGVKSFDLVSADGRPLPPPSPGAHIDVHAAPGVVRQYSLCNGPDERLGYVIAVRRDPASRGGSRVLHDEIRPGDRLVISRPRNHFPLRREASRHVLVAQDIGVAPILSMARSLAAAGAAFTLDHFVRSREHAPFRQALLAAPLRDKTQLHCGLDVVQQAHVLRRRLADQPEGAHLYLCGGREFMQLALVEACAWPADRVHCEYFYANPAAWAGERHGFHVRLARRGMTVAVPPDRTLAQALEQAGAPVDAPCGQGVCGQCAVRVLAGRPDHRDVVLSALERERGGLIIPCVSRALDAELTLDL